MLARCPLTVVDLGNLGYAERSSVLASMDSELARIVAGFPAGSTLLVTAPGATTKPPHLQLALVSGPGYPAGLLNAASTRQPGLVVLTDLTPTVLGWLGRAMPTDAVGAQITRGDRGSLAPTVRSLAGRDTAEQVWRSTHEEFFWAYAVADGVVLAAIGLAFWGAARSGAGSGPAGGGWPGCSPPRCPWARSWPTWCRGRCPPTRRRRCTGWPWGWPSSSPWPRCSVPGGAIRSRRSA